MHQPAPTANWSPPGPDNGATPLAPTTEGAPRRSWLRVESIHNSASFLISFMFHFGLVVVLAMYTILEPPTKQIELVVIEPELEEHIKPLEIELDESEKIAEEMTIANLTTTEQGLQGMVEASLTAPQLEMPPTEFDNAPLVSLEADALLTKDTDSLIEDMPLGTVGSVQAVVGDYQEAMDQISQELIWMLSHNKVLVIWLFDQSESMKDDQEDIRRRIHRIYAEVGLSEHARGDALTTAVASFGQGFLMHTKAPTNDPAEVDQAIAAVPVDPSGEEMFSSAVAEVLTRHRRYAKIADRKIALIVVTDESGNSADNESRLETSIGIAKATDARVFVLGREAVFGYPYAHVRWTHPENGTDHLLPVDRGPEAAIIEQLQTDGFGKRTDALASGFGPFEQVRLAKETGGIFFMLPGEESNVNNAIDRRYEPKTMDMYRPDLRSRLEQVGEVKKDPLKTLVTKIIYDLNPYQESVADVIEIQQSFSPDLRMFRQQVRQQQAKMITYITYLDRAIEVAEKNRDLRDDSTSLRWSANYDLLYGQLLAYRARAFEYGAYLTKFAENPPAPPQMPPYMEFRGWRLATTDELSAPEKTEADISLSREILQYIREEHEGTPWATRATWEIKRGFGVKLEPVFFDTRRINRPRPVGNGPAPPPVQIPKL
ncbi:vWA domain-containing protein [Bremerella sp. JC817]|uniref:vWA domain-containing protein n=1 Tax=Bremerella sp. JC817 TaxID=3231756 RepID=UPI0034583DB9